MAEQRTCKILIGEDDHEDQMILEEYFEDNGLSKEKLVFERNGKRVIEYLDKVTNEDVLPSLIVLDLNMPILNGTQTLFQLKQSPRYKRIPVIIYSTSNNDHEKRKCLSFGAEDYLVKPITFDEGQKMVERFLEFVK